MKKLNLILNSLTSIVLAASISSAYASAGGQSGGGGNALALEFKATAETALKNLQSMKGAPFSSMNIALLQRKIDSAQILVSNSALPVSKDGFTQDGTAENQPSQNLIIINGTEYPKIGSAVVQQALALHELLSLAGVESTGNYPISGAYLIAEGGGTSSTASQTISLASQSVDVENLSWGPCTKDKNACGYQHYGIFKFIDAASVAAGSPIQETTCFPTIDGKTPVLVRTALEFCDASFREVDGKCEAFDEYGNSAGSAANSKCGMPDVTAVHLGLQHQCTIKDISTDVGVNNTCQIHGYSDAGGDEPYGAFCSCQEPVINKAGWEPLTCQQIFERDQRTIIGDYKMCNGLASSDDQNGNSASLTSKVASVVPADSGSSVRQAQGSDNNTASNEKLCKEEVNNLNEEIGSMLTSCADISMCEGSTSFWGCDYYVATCVSNGIQQLEQNYVKYFPSTEVPFSLEHFMDNLATFNNSYTGGQDEIDSSDTDINNHVKQVKKDLTGSCKK